MCDFFSGSALLEPTRHGGGIVSHTTKSCFVSTLKFFFCFSVLKAALLFLLNIVVSAIHPRAVLTPPTPSFCIPMSFPIMAFSI